MVFLSLTLLAGFTKVQAVFYISLKWLIARGDTEPFILMVFGISMVFLASVVRGKAFANRLTKDTRNARTPRGKSLAYQPQVFGFSGSFLRGTEMPSTPHIHLSSASEHAMAGAEGVLTRQ